MDMYYYHGTSCDYARQIIAQGIDFSLGSGEFGQGFYVGSLNYKAYAWAYSRYKNKYSVLEVKLDEDAFIDCNPLCLNIEEAYRERAKIKRNSQTQTFLFRRNAVWGPVVGVSVIMLSFNQIKFEASVGTDLFNQRITKL